MGKRVQSGFGDQVKGLTRSDFDRRTFDYCTPTRYLITEIKASKVYLLDHPPTKTLAALQALICTLKWKLKFVMTVYTR